MRIDKMDSAQVTRVLINPQLAAQQVHLVKPGFLPRFRQVNGAVREFLKAPRTVQNLPSYAKRMRE